MLAATAIEAPEGKRNSQRLLILKIHQFKRYDSVMDRWHCISLLRALRRCSNAEVPPAGLSSDSIAHKATLKLRGVLSNSYCALKSKAQWESFLITPHLHFHLRRSSPTTIKPPKHRLRTISFASMFTHLSRFLTATSVAAVNSTSTHSHFQSPDKCAPLISISSSL